MSGPSPAELMALLGAGIEVTDGPSDAGPGMPVVRPRSAEEVSTAMRTATSRGWAVTIRGGGTKSGWGPAADRSDIILDTTELKQMVEHEPGDLVCVAGAGMRLGELRALTAQTPGYRQRLMLDPPRSELSTLGGLVATRASGPLRARYGTMRDLLLGARFVLADGTVAHTGGKVVKNVAGYDLDKLLVGSLGTLAVVVEVALRLHPQADSRGSVLLEHTDPARGAAFLAHLRRAPAVPSVAEAVWPEGVVLVQFDSTGEGAQRQAELVAKLDPAARVLDLAEASYWEKLLEDRPWNQPGTVLGISIPLRATQPLLELVDGLARRGQPVALSLRGTVGSGEIRVDETSAAIQEMRQAVERLDGHLEIHRAEGERRLGSLPRDPVARELMGTVKRALDPTGTLAPGRLEWACGAASAAGGSRG